LLLGGQLAGAPAWAFGDDPVMGETITEYLTPAILQALFPGAERIGAVGGTPPSAPVYGAGRIVGYVFSTWDVTRSRGYSNRPIVLLVGLGLNRRIAGAKIVHHTEPIGLLGLRDEVFFRFADQFRNYDISNGADVVKEPTPSPSAGSVTVDAVARATTSSVLMSDAVVRGARMVARSRGLLPAAGHGVRLDLDRFEPADWPALEAAGAIAHLHLTYGEVLARLGQRGATRIVNGSTNADAAATFLDLYTALLTPASIGLNVLDKRGYDQYSAGRGIDDQLLLVGVKGPVSLLGDGVLELEQDGRTIRLASSQIKVLRTLHAEAAPDLTEQALVFLQRSGLDPTRPFHLRLLIAGETADGKPAFADVALPYRVPDKYLLPATGASGLAWRAIWRARAPDIAVLGAGLIALTLILLMQDRISRHKRLHRAIRIGFLVWTLVWLGWYAGAQLTVVQVITAIHSLATGFRWDYLLADPLITILLAFTLVGLLVWGRAAFCGWLCPFGALQELISEAARRLRVPQIRVGPGLHGRLVVGKYALFVALVTISFWSWDLGMAGSEIEPFKAAIVLRFMTAWPMVAYALALLAAGLFIERFYCRFACPLGGGLAIFGELRMVDWLKRHPECGSRCRHCETVCPIGAIRRDGSINMNECFFCLDCQVTYYDAHTCPPMVWRRKQAERAAGSSAL
jgi:transcriptional regulator of nitric oxide reductase